jgi:hypothetical protein
VRGHIEGLHRVDEQGRPAGGHSSGRGIEVTWQDGPLAVDGVRREPNGAFVEDVIAIALDRIEFYNDGQFRCRENSLAITKLEEALHWLDHRTRDREARGVEGTHQV